MNAPLSLRGVRVSVPDGASERVLFDDLDLDLEAGRVAVVTGRSGTGKSTLLAITGLLSRPPQGEVLIQGEPTAALSEKARARLRLENLGFVYQSANLIPNLTAVEQLELVDRIAGKRGDRARAMALLDELGVASRADALPGKLSGGERQRVGIARALMGDPKVILADEPTASLDPELAVEVSALLAEQSRRRGVATMIVTHDQAPLAIADVELRLENGRLQAVDRTESISSTDHAENQGRERR